MAREQSNRYKSSRNADTAIAAMGKLQPQALELEEAILGALMLEKDAFSEVCDILQPDSFYKPAHKSIYEAILALTQKSLPVDMLTVIEKLRNMGKLEEVGGEYAIYNLTSKVSSAANIEFHAKIVAQKYMARQLIAYAGKIQTNAYDDTYDIDALMEQTEADLFKLSQENIKRDAIQINPVISEAMNLLQQAMKRKSGLSGLQTGFHELDKITSGWQRSDLIIVAARPAMGKTAFSLSMAKNMALNYGTGVALFSLEMANVQLVNRLIVNTCEIKGEKLRSGKLDDHEMTQLQTKIKELEDAPIYVDETANLSVFELRSKARRLVREHNVGMIIIDYLQLMTLNSKDDKTALKVGSREQEVSAISRSLKGLAKELNIPIIALSQLSRQSENRDGKRPQLSDLRESGAIEQDADIVCFIHRPEYYGILTDQDGRSTQGLAELIIAKHRNGATGSVWFKFKKDYARFQNLDDDSIINIESGMNSGVTTSTPSASSSLSAYAGDEEAFLQTRPDEF
ncbi:MAG: replicative DNA helicase [Bacteroidales bacterium]|nr:replicative DNA helicase [Bacteroidales bacterium]